ncbi:MAG: hypothetical protein V4538_06500 [Bacteroidota bacterium]
MEEKTSFIDPLFEKVEAYGKSSFELFKLKTLDKTASVAAILIARAVVILFFILFLLTANIGVALWLGDILGKSYYGFFCVAGFYALVIIILYAFMGKYIQRKVNQVIISQMLND